MERKECSSNRRKVEISITKKGLEQLAIFDREVEAIHTAYSNNLNTREMSELSILLEKLFRNEKQNN